MRKNNKGSIMTNHQYEKEEKSREKIKEYYMTGQISSEVAAYILRLLGFSILRGKEIVKQWASEKPDAK
jgi:hypothetical protein